MKRNWIPGPPQGEIEPDRLYAVLMQPTAGYSVGVVIRGEDCNWQKTTIGHLPLPVTMNSAEARRLQRVGWYEIPKTTQDAVSLWQIQAQARKWLQEPKPDNGEPEPEEIAEARTIMEALLNCDESNDLLREHFTNMLRSLEGANEANYKGKLAAETKVAGYRALLEQIAQAIPLGINVPDFDYSAATMDEQALSDIDMLIGTFGDKPEEIASETTCKWSQDPSGEPWHTECEVRSSISPSSGIKCCPWCGRPINLTEET